MEKIDVVVLDKTGTMTHGNFRLVDFALAGQQSDDADVLLHHHLPVLASIEQLSEHLVGRAVVQFAREHGVVPTDVQSVEVHKGEGISSLRDGRLFFIGNRKMAMSNRAPIGADLEAIALQWQQQGRTVAYFGQDQELLGLLAFGDSVKEGAAETVARLRERGIAVKLVSGDAAATTASIAKEIGVEDFTGEAGPLTKADIVRSLQQGGRRVAVIGDGVNDAPALAQADLGIALGTGADIAMSAAPVVLVGGSLEKIDEAFRLAFRTTRIVRQNLFWAFFYNIAGLTLGIIGLLNPIVAAGAMFLSSTSVVANSMRLSRQDDSGD
jgi:Cu+-exporting ATPase